MAVAFAACDKAEIDNPAVDPFTGITTGYYWSSSLRWDFYVVNARLVYFNSSGARRDNIHRYYGLSVRPVSE